MSVERMEMMNLIGRLEDINRVSIEIVRQGSVHIVNALNEINENNFNIMTPEQDTNALMDLNFIKAYDRPREHDAALDRISELMDIFSIPKAIKKEHTEKNIGYDELIIKIDRIYDKVLKFHNSLNDINTELFNVQEFREYMVSIRDVGLDFNKLKKMEFFNFTLGKLSKENYEKLNDNIENISSIIYKICTIPGAQVILSIAPKALGNEMGKILHSLSFEEIEIPFGLSGTPESMIAELNEKIRDMEKEKNKIESEIDKLKKEFVVFIDESYSFMKLLEKAESISMEAACTNDFFYMAGWVPISEQEGLEKRLSNFDNQLLLTFKPESEVGSSITPPTKLKNNWFIRPFEAIVRMYGIPSYNEADPTKFVAISYMIMFGSMFGDAGQGLIFLIAGLFLSIKMRRPNLGGVLSRIGLSSMIFGVLFGSVFGDEHIIKPLLFYPMENINTILMGGVVLGVVFTTIGFIFSLVNAVKRRSLEDGVFGKDGVVGLLFYWIIILTAASIYNFGSSIIPIPTVIIILCILLCFMVVKRPLSNMLTGHKPLYDESVQDYYIESGFGVFETLLSMLSNTISFIRVGAFALNHVGLFIAFATIAKMMNSGAAGVGMLVLGNIVIIGLEGLIVFIQGLRLEYYEIFSKFYEGAGIEYSPVRLEYTNTRIVVKPNMRTDLGHQDALSEV